MKKKIILSALAIVVIRQSGISPTIHQEFIKSRDFQGDLTTMFYPDRQSLDWQYTLDAYERQFAELRPIRTWEDLRIETRASGGDKRLLMYRDSFANALIPQLSNAFSQATYLRSSRNDLREVAEQVPDVVVYEIVERNLDWLLKETPIMLAPEVDVPQATPGTETASIQITTQYGYDYLNAKWHGGEDIERVIVSSDGVAYEAFPIYQTNVDSGDLEPGFSLYTESLGEDLAFYYLQAGKWYQMDVKTP